ncbi:MAG: GNAT family N-acetyltransferase [Firmicutes bacterium HGW-Firmicutes-15]|nr:MAG: GNAT family N-acetyltransferase [Firmicutes bacterium HGW-Firmicutes-15]
MNFTLREWELGDAESLVKYANNQNIAQNLRNIFPHPYTIEDAKSFINDCINGDKTRQCIKAIVVDGEAAGSIGVLLKNDVYCKSAEIGYWLGEYFWSKGIMSAAVKQIFKVAFNEYDIVRIFAETYAYNIGSRKVLEKAGFELEGVLKKSICKNGQIFDSCIYAFIK